MENEYILECHGLSKAFAGTKALTEVDMMIRPGTVHALMGENGAGKSTLMKCIIGLLEADSGTVTFEGKHYHAKNPAEAAANGIAMVHQELNVEPYLTIAENIFLHREDTTGPFLNKKATLARAQEILDKYNFGMPAKTEMKQLPLAKAQMVEIIKAVSQNARLIIMDEPTSSLDSEETEHLFNTIRNLRSQGKTIIYISHRMEEIFEICDDYTVFRDGRSVGCGRVADITTRDLVTLMVGREVKNIFPKVDCPIGEVELELQNLTGKGFKDISFQVHRGEILGLTGLVGAGRSETVSAIFGLIPPTSGKILLEGRELHSHTPTQAIASGIAMVNEDRKKYGLCLMRSLRENISLPNLRSRQKKLLLNQKREKKECADFAREMTVKSAGLEIEASSLSGGNQQKVVLAKWLMAQPKVLILDEPTRGVDVGAKAEIHTQICKLAASGIAIIMISSELPEIMGMSDRILVYHEGQLNGVIMRSEILSGAATQETILAKEFGQ